jgi:ADP-heptose:LPS heptosyltransferase
MRVLVRRDFAAGDVLLVTPVLAAMRAAWPHTAITVATKLPHLLRDNPDVAAVRPAADPAGYDRFHDLNLAYERRPTLHIVDAYADVCGVVVRDRRPRLYPNAEERAFAARLLDGGRWAVVHPGPTGGDGWPGRNLPTRSFEFLCGRLREEGWRVVLVGAKGSGALPNDLDLRGGTTIHQLASITEMAGVFVGIDSLPMHVAVAMDRPVVAAFGCIEPRYRLPDAPRFMGVTAPAQHVWCLGCHHHLPAPRTVGGCFRDRVYCMEMLDPEQLCEAVRVVTGTMLAPA